MTIGDAINNHFKRRAIRKELKYYRSERIYHASTVSQIPEDLRETHNRMFIAINNKIESLEKLLLEI